MNFEEYQKKSRETVIYPNKDDNFIYPVLEQLKLILKSCNQERKEISFTEVAIINKIIIKEWNYIF